MPRRAKRPTLFQGLLATAIFVFIYLVIATFLTALVYLLYQQGYIGQNNFNFLTDVASLLPLSIAIGLYLLFYKRMTPSKIGRSLGFISDGVSGKVLLGIFIFLIIIIFEILIGLISAATNVPINTNTSIVYAGAPMWFFVFIAVIEPINEEIMFRGFLVPRIGIIPSAVIFGLAHYSYMSTFGVEMIGALIFGLITGYVFKKTKSIYPGIVAHILVNTIAVIGLIALS